MSSLVIILLILLIILPLVKATSHGFTIAALSCNFPPGHPFFIPRLDYELYQICLHAPLGTVCHTLTALILFLEENFVHGIFFSGHNDAPFFDTVLRTIVNTLGLIDRNGELEIFPPEVIASTIGAFSPAHGGCLEFVFLSACMIFPLGLLLVDEGVPYVIGWVTRVRNEAAILFSAVRRATSNASVAGGPLLTRILAPPLPQAFFYSHAQGNSIPLAFRFACTRVAASYRLGDPDGAWRGVRPVGIPILLSHCPLLGTVAGLLAFNGSVIRVRGGGDRVRTPPPAMVEPLPPGAPVRKVQHAIFTGNRIRSLQRNEDKEEKPSPCKGDCALCLEAVDDGLGSPAKQVPPQVPRDVPDLPDSG